MQSSLRWILLSFFGALFLYGAARFFVFGPIVIPIEFTTARNDGERLTTEIMAISRVSLDALQEISVYDRGGNRGDALAIVSRELIRTKESHDRAVQLSVALARMAEQIPHLQPTKAKEQVSEAMSYAMAMVGRFISYNDGLRELFEVLRGKFVGTLAPSDGRVRELLTNVNISANSINALSAAFTDAMGKFDREYGGK